MSAKCEVQGLVKRFGSHAAVNNISFSVDQGEFVVLLGPSGCGKTTTLRLIAGLEKPDDGTIALNGATVSAPTRHLFVPPERRDIGMVFQSGVTTRAVPKTHAKAPRKIERIARDPAASYLRGGDSGAVRC
jgi:iron(III) transport system ATP-binding protein